jgi:hypothetical protein
MQLKKSLISNAIVAYKWPFPAINFYDHGRERYTLSREKSADEGGDESRRCFYFSKKGGEMHEKDRIDFGNALPRSDRRNGLW